MQDDEEEGPSSAPPAADAEEDDGDFDDDDLLASTAGVDEEAAASRPAQSGTGTRQALPVECFPGTSVCCFYIAMLALMLFRFLSKLSNSFDELREQTCGSHMQVGRAATANSIWQHLPGHVQSGTWLELHDGAGCDPGAAKAVPHEADLQIECS